MNGHKRMLLVFLVAMAAVLLAAAAPAAWARGGGDDDDDDETPFAVANIFFELNDTDGDLGIHALIDGDAWRLLEIESPDEHEKLKITARGTLRRHGLTELFFESAEPSFDELRPAKFFRRFPAGEWEVSGETIEGDELESTTVLRHVMPAPPGNIRVSGMAVPEDCDEGPVPSVVAAMPITISWDPVVGSHPEIGEPGAIVVSRYQAVVEREEPEPLKFTVDLPPSITVFQLPPGLLGPGEEVKVEVLVREETGNQTATESCFETE